jgi:excinuclease ABC subunit C
MHLVQQIRDEAHRFALSGHRRQRERQAGSSPLAEIKGIGAKRRQLLLQQFGGLQNVASAGIDDLARVDGISRQLATRIYDTFHGGD